MNNGGYLYVPSCKALKLISTTFINSDVNYCFSIYDTEPKNSLFLSMCPKMVRNVLLRCNFFPSVAYRGIVLANHFQTSQSACLFWLMNKSHHHNLRVTRIASNISSQYHPWITPYAYEKRGNDHQLKKLLTVKTNSPYQRLRKCTENSMENMHIDFRV